MKACFHSRSFTAATILLFLGSAPLSAQEKEPSQAKPNILIILADDLGYSDLGCYGGEIQTPHLDRLANNGLRFTQFYNTARCWPTRSCILTGYYAQQVNMDGKHLGKPAPNWVRLLPHYLRLLGYRCYHAGKWHLRITPRALADAGFDRSYLLVDQNRFFTPQVHFEDDRKLAGVKAGSGYYATTAIADHAINHLKEHAAKHPGRPFFHYLAFTAPHFPLHALPQDIAHYRDKYLVGWDEIRARRLKRLREMGIAKGELPPLETKLKPRNVSPDLLAKVGPGEIKRAAPWVELTEVQRRFQAGKMALHAAMVHRVDVEIGRVLDQLRAMGALDNTIIFFLSDNGASAEMLVRGDGHDRQAEPGSAATYLSIGPGWGSAANTPFRRFKIWLQQGGISTPLIVHWPKGIPGKGGLRHDVGHVIDFVPTILHLAGSKTPNHPQAPSLPGRSLVPAFAKDGTVHRDFLYFSHENNRGLRVGNWMLVSATEDGNAWELYDLSTDRAEMHNLANKYPERVRAMAEQWQRLHEEFLRR